MSVRSLRIRLAAVVAFLFGPLLPTPAVAHVTAFDIFLTQYYQQIGAAPPIVHSFDFLNPYAFQASWK